MDSPTTKSKSTKTTPDPSAPFDSSSDMIKFISELILENDLHKIREYLNTFSESETNSKQPPIIQIAATISEDPKLFNFLASNVQYHHSFADPLILFLKDNPLSRTVVPPVHIFENSQSNPEDVLPTKSHTENQKWTTFCDIISILVPYSETINTQSSIFEAAIRYSPAAVPVLIKLKPDIFEESISREFPGLPYSNDADPITHQNCFHLLASQCRPSDTPNLDDNSILNFILNSTPQKDTFLEMLLTTDDSGKSPISYSIANNTPQGHLISKTIINFCKFIDTCPTIANKYTLQKLLISSHYSTSMASIAIQHNNTEILEILLKELPNTAFATFRLDESQHKSISKMQDWFLKLNQSTTTCEVPFAPEELRNARIQPLLYAILLCNVEIVKMLLKFKSGNTSIMINSSPNPVAYAVQLASIIVPTPISKNPYYSQGFGFVQEEISILLQLLRTGQVHFDLDPMSKSTRVGIHSILTKFLSGKYESTFGDLDFVLLLFSNNFDFYPYFIDQNVPTGMFVHLKRTLQQFNILFPPIIHAWHIVDTSDEHQFDPMAPHCQSLQKFASTFNIMFKYPSFVGKLRKLQRDASSLVNSQKQFESIPSPSTILTPFLHRMIAEIIDTAAPSASVLSSFKSKIPFFNAQSTPERILKTEHEPPTKRHIHTKHPLFYSEHLEMKSEFLNSSNHTTPTSHIPIDTAFLPRVHMHSFTPFFGYELAAKAQGYLEFPINLISINMPTISKSFSVFCLNLILFFEELKQHKKYPDSTFRFGFLVNTLKHPMTTFLDSRNNCKTHFISLLENIDDILYNYKDMISPLSHNLGNITDFHSNSPKPWFYINKVDLKHIKRFFSLDSLSITFRPIENIHQDILNSHRPRYPNSWSLGIPKGFDSSGLERFPSSIDPFQDFFISNDHLDYSKICTKSDYLLFIPLKHGRNVPKSKGGDSVDSVYDDLKQKLEPSAPPQSPGLTFVIKTPFLLTEIFSCFAFAVMDTLSQQHKPHSSDFLSVFHCNFSITDSLKHSFSHFLAVRYPHFYKIVKTLNKPDIDTIYTAIIQRFVDAKYLNHDINEGNYSFPFLVNFYYYQLITELRTYSQQKWNQNLQSPGGKTSPPQYFLCTTNLWDLLTLSHEFLITRNGSSFRHKESLISSLFFTHKVYFTKLYELGILFDQLLRVGSGSGCKSKSHLDSENATLVFHPPGHPPGYDSSWESVLNTCFLLFTATYQGESQNIPLEKKVTSSVKIKSKTKKVPEQVLYTDTGQLKNLPLEQLLYSCQQYLGYIGEYSVDPLNYHSLLFFIVLRVLFVIYHPTLLLQFIPKAFLTDISNLIPDTPPPQLFPVVVDDAPEPSGSTSSSKKDIKDVLVVEDVVSEGDQSVPPPTGSIPMSKRYLFSRNLPASIFILGQAIFRASLSLTPSQVDHHLQIDRHSESAHGDPELQSVFQVLFVLEAITQFNTPSDVLNLFKGQLKPRSLNFIASWNPEEKIQQLQQLGLGLPNSDKQFSIGEFFILTDPNSHFRLAFSESRNLVDPYSADVPHLGLISPRTLLSFETFN